MFQNIFFLGNGSRFWHKFLFPGFHFLLFNRAVRHFLQVVEKQRATFEFEVNEDEVDGRWMRNGVEIQFSAEERFNYITIRKLHRLTISETYRSDAGEYTFLAGKNRSTMNLHVRCKNWQICHQSAFMYLHHTQKMFLVPYVYFVLMWKINTTTVISRAVYSFTPVKVPIPQYKKFWSTKVKVLKYNMNLFVVSK